LIFGVWWTAMIPTLKSNAMEFSPARQKDAITAGFTKSPPANDSNGSIRTKSNGLPASRSAARASRSFVKNASPDSNHCTTVVR
jgi:hypothetical protein